MKGGQRKKMKKLSIVLIGLIIVLSIQGLPLAQEKASPEKATVAGKEAGATEAKALKPEEAKPEAAKPEEAKKEKPQMVRYRMGGLVVALDTPGRKITIKQDKVYRERKVTLTVSKKAAKDLAGINVGSEVNVWVTGKVITALRKVS
jgi:hypothetical protein